MPIRSLKISELEFKIKHIAPKNNKTRLAGRNIPTIHQLATCDIRERAQRLAAPVKINKISGLLLGIIVTIHTAIVNNRLSGTRIAQIARQLFLENSAIVMIVVTVYPIG